jgi:hypothetical protein
MIQFLTQHQFSFAVAIYWIFSAAVSSMPEPKPGDAGGYLWLYRFVHTIAGNLTTAFGNRFPGSKLLPLVLVVPILLPFSSCAAHYAVHPGALNPADSAAYDTLLVAESVIDAARSAIEAGTIPRTEKDALNILLHSYNVARESWLTYRGALATNIPSDQYFQQLTKNLSDLTNAIQAVKEVKNDERLDPATGTSGARVGSNPTRTR